MIITKQITNDDILDFVFCDLSPAPRFNIDGKEETSQIMIPWTLYLAFCELAPAPRFNIEIRQRRTVDQLQSMCGSTVNIDALQY